VKIYKNKKQLMKNYVEYKTKIYSKFLISLKENHVYGILHNIVKVVLYGKYMIIKGCFK